MLTLSPGGNRLLVQNWQGFRALFKPSLRLFFVFSSIPLFFSGADRRGCLVSVRALGTSVRSAVVLRVIVATSHVCEHITTGRAIAGSPQSWYCVSIVKHGIYSNTPRYSKKFAHCLQHVIGTKKRREQKQKLTRAPARL